MLLVFWRQRLVNTIVFHLYFGQKWSTLQRELSAIAELLVSFDLVLWTKPDSRPFSSGRLICISIWYGIALPYRHDQKHNHTTVAHMYFVL